MKKSPGMMRFGSADYHCLACAGGSIATAIMLYSFKMATVFCPNSSSVTAALKWFGHVGFCELAVLFFESRAEIASPGLAEQKPGAGLLKVPGADTRS